MITSALFISGCTSSSFNEMKNDQSVLKQRYSVDQNYQYLFKNSLEKSHECFDMGLITGALTTDGQLYGDLKEAELYTYVIGGFGKQMRFGATMNATADNKTDLMIYYYGMNSENMMSIIKRTYTGECKSCRCVEEDKAK